MRVLRQSKDRNQEGDDEFLASLSRKLKKLSENGILSQIAIEEATGVDQTTVSRALNGRLRRITDKVRRLDNYADMRDREMQLPDEVHQAAVAFLRAGGQTKELLAFIRSATRLVIRSMQSDSG